MPVLQSCGRAISSAQVVLMEVDVDPEPLIDSEDVRRRFEEAAAAKWVELQECLVKQHLQLVNEWEQEIQKGIGTFRQIRSRAPGVTFAEDLDSSQTAVGAIVEIREGEQLDDHGLHVTVFEPDASMPSEPGASMEFEPDTSVRLERAFDSSIMLCNCWIDDAEVNELEDEDQAEAAETFLGLYAEKEASDQDLLNAHMVVGLATKPHSPHRMCWEFFGLALLCYDFVVIPLQVFPIKQQRWIEVCNIVGVVYWTIDLVSTFFLGYYRDSGELVLDCKKTAWNYLRTWFVHDAIINIIDWSTVVNRLRGEDGPGILQAIGIARLSKIIRCLRCARLFRLRRMRSIVHLIQDRTDSGVLTIATKLIVNLMAIVAFHHAFGCLWYWAGTVQNEDSGSWVSASGYAGSTWSYLYWVCFFWSMQKSYVKPTNVVELVYASFASLLSVLILSSFTAIVTNLISRLRNMRAKHEEQLWLLRKYLRQHKVSWDLSIRVARYANLALGMQNGLVQEQDVEILGILSEPLHVELKSELYMRHISHHPFFRVLYQKSTAMTRHLCSSAMRQCFLSWSDVLFHGGEVAKDMFFLVHGFMRYLSYRTGAVAVPVTNKQWFCELALWIPWVHGGQMLALRECELIALDAKGFQEAAAHHHRSVRFPRRYARAIMMALREIRKNGSDDVSISDLTMDLCQSPSITKVLCSSGYESFVEDDGDSYRTLKRGRKMTLTATIMQSFGRQLRDWGSGWGHIV